MTQIEQSLAAIVRVWMMEFRPDALDRSAHYHAYARFLGAI